jgi:tripartite-type tricarboxylate transporter receptor subunit TctC
VVNKEGASGTIGLSEVMRAKPDGYTLGITTTTATSIQPHFEETPFEHDSFQAVIRTSAVPQVLVVKEDAIWKTFEEWLEYVKRNPGKFTYSIPVKAGSQFMAMEALAKETGIEVKAVPFDGAAPATTALLGGHVDGMLVQSVDARAQVESGTVRELVNVGSNKVGANEDTPLLTEKGIDVVFDIYSGILAPKGIPQDVRDTLHEAFKKALEEPEVIEQFAKMGIEPTYAGPEDFQKEITNSFEVHGEIMKDLGLIK